MSKDTLEIEGWKLERMSWWYAWAERGNWTVSIDRDTGELDIDCEDGACCRIPRAVLEQLQRWHDEEKPREAQ